ncbi:MAG TPA: pyridoxal phosphate-dependent aminotransferase [Gammaproteobacteria bacterium]|nr:pyridoxal phosphate-dependent aminotransferase [Gammaproteobacteria bacterium]
MISNRIQSIKPSPTFEIAARVQELRLQGTDVIALNAGEPDFDTPLHIKAAGIEAIHDGFTRYTAIDGIMRLKEAIQNKFKTQNDLEYALNEIIACSGAKQALSNALFALLNPGDEVIIPTPYWPSYYDGVKLAEATPVVLNTSADHYFIIDPEELQKVISSKTKILILNSPNNPSGCFYQESQLKAIADVLLEYPNITIISDEIYEHILWDHEYVNILNVMPELKDRTVIINGVSKAYAMTGWRIGYAAGPKHIIKAMKTIQSQTTSCPSSIAQVAAAEAIESHDESVQEMNDIYYKRMQFVLETIPNIPGLKAIAPQGTFFMLIDASEAISMLKLKDDIELCTYLINTAHVALIPGSAFGCKNHLRLSFACSKSYLQNGLTRIADVLKEGNQIEPSNDN